MPRETFREIPEIPQDDREKEVSKDLQPPEELPQPEKQNQVQELGDTVAPPGESYVENPKETVEQTKETPEEPEKQDKPGVAEKLMKALGSGRAGKIIRAFALVAALSSGAVKKSEAANIPPAGSPKMIELLSTPTESARRHVPLESHMHEGIGIVQLPHVHDTFTRRGEDGELEFNPWSILSPLQLELSKTRGKEARHVRLPQRYNHLFESGGVLRPEDRERVLNILRQDLLQDFADKVYGLSPDKDVNKVKHGEPLHHHRHIEEITVVGMTSPEGPHSDGSKTIRPQYFDKENIDLGFSRSGEELETIKDALENTKGISDRQIRHGKEALISKELKLEDTEIRQLAELADDYDGADDTERVYNLIAAYNRGAVEDQDAIRALDSIVGSKRMVKIEVVYENNNKTTVLIPLPITPLLLLLALRRFNSREE